MSGTRRYIFVPLGSAGDVNPLLWLAHLAAERGHEVVLVTHAAAADLCKDSGFRTVSVGASEELEAIIRNPDIWHPDKAFVILAKQLPIWARRMIPAISDEILPGRTTIVSGGIAFGARMVAEARQIPLVTVQLQPAVFMGVDDAPVLRLGLEWIKQAPRWMRALFYRLAQWRADQLLREPINRIRCELGLRTPVGGVMREWWMSPDRVLAVFPEWFAPRHCDWPRQTVFTRFPLYDSSHERPISPEIEAFIDGGDPPVLVTPGSANAQAREFFAEASKACILKGHRALFVTRYPEQLPCPMPAGSISCEYVPFGAVFERCAAVMHHGGIGTCSQGLAAGVPQLLMPMSHDQPDNAWRLKHLGVGEYIPPRRFCAKAIASVLETLMVSPGVAAACRGIKERMAAQMAPDDVSRLLELPVARDAP